MGRSRDLRLPFGVVGGRAQHEPLSAWAARDVPLAASATLGSSTVGLNLPPPPTDRAAHRPAGRRAGHAPGARSASGPPAAAAGKGRRAAATVRAVSASTRSADDILSLLRARGARVTASRRAVVEALVAGGHHVTADEIVERVAARRGIGAGDPDAHRATVYRTLDRLEELGVVSHVHLGHGPSTFHLDHGDGEPHHHAVCSSCGAVVEIPLAALDTLATQLRAADGFELSRQHFALSGRCAGCARRETAAGDVGSAVSGG